MLTEGDRDDAERAIPPTIDALLSARLDRLGPGERAVISRAAIVGKEFSAEATLDLLPEDARAFGPRHLETLVRKEFIGPAPTDGLGAGFRFRHILIQQAAYRATPKTLRAELHERFADWVGRSRPRRARRALRGRRLSPRAGVSLPSRARPRRCAGAGRSRTEPATISPPPGSRRSSAATCRRRSTCSVARPRSRRRRAGPASRRCRSWDTRCSRSARSTRRAPCSPALASGRAPTAIAASSGGSRSHGHGSRCTGIPERSTLTRSRWRPRRRSTCSASSATRPGWRARTWSSPTSSGARAGSRETSDAATRAAEHARRAGNRREVGWALGQNALCAIHGPMPVAEGLDWLERLLRGEPENRTLDANLSGFVALLEAMSGRFDEARRHIKESRALARDLGSDLAGGRPGAAQRLRRAARGRSGRRRARHAGGRGGLSRDRRGLVPVHRRGRPSARGLRAGSLRRRLRSARGDRRTAGADRSRVADQAHRRPGAVARQTWPARRGRAPGTRGRGARR